MDWAGGTGKWYNTNIANRQLTERTNKFLEITDPKKAVGLWSYRVVREMPMTSVGETDKALGRFLNGDIVRWEHRAKMAEALVGKGVGTKGGKSPVRALEGRVYLYSIDFGKDKWLADLVYTSGNGNPCRIVSTVPVLVPVDAKKGDSSRDRKSGKDIETPIPAGAERVDAFITFIFNPSIARNMRKWDGRSWKGYCDAIPSDSSRTVVRWPSNEGSAADALRVVIKTDGVLLTDKEHLDEANRAAAYIDGYNLKDRVFVEDGRVDWRAAQELSDKKHNIRRRKLQRIRQKERKGKPLVEIVAQPETLAALRREWVRLIEGDNLTDKKTAKVFYTRRADPHRRRVQGNGRTRVRTGRLHRHDEVPVAACSPRARSRLGHLALPLARVIGGG